MKMTVGVNTATFGWSFFEGISWLGENAFDFVELSCGDVPNRSDYISPHLINDAFITKLKDACAGFSFVTIHPERPCAFLTIDNEVRVRSISEMCLFIDLAGELGARVLTFHSGSAPEGASEAMVRELCADSFGRLLQHAQARGVRLALEVLDYFGTTERFGLLDELNLDGLGITLDVGHLSFPHPQAPGRPSYFPLPSIGMFIERFSERLIHLHIHDYDGRHDHIPLGEGFIDFPNIISSLRNINYTGALCFEFTPKVQPAMILASRARLHRLIKEQG